jgi:hypothetical protein
MLQDCFEKTGQKEKGKQVLELMELGDPEGAEKIKLADALIAGNLREALALAPEDFELCQFANAFCKCYKSPRKAQLFNALLPGAGYYYVGQKKSALTSFAINTIFVAASYHFFRQGNWGAGLITASLEMGWYVGGINGAGIAAVEFNERIYERCTSQLMEEKGLFPLLMLETSF